MHYNRGIQVQKAQRMDHKITHQAKIIIRFSKQGARNRRYKLTSPRRRSIIEATQPLHSRQIML